MNVISGTSCTCPEQQFYYKDKKAEKCGRLRDRDGENKEDCL